MIEQEIKILEELGFKYRKSNDREIFSIELDDGTLVGRTYSKKHPSGLFWAKREGEFLSNDEVESLPIVQEFYQSLRTREETREEKPTPMTLSKFFHTLLGRPDLLMIFGETGTGKTKLALKTAQEIVSDGGKVAYFDTEANLPPGDFKVSYTYIPSLQGLSKAVNNLEAGFNLVVIDSIGVPVLGAYAQASLHERGNMLLQMQGIAYRLKQYSYDNKAYVLIINQPISELSAMMIENEAERKQALLDRRPFGDKTCFFVKEILRTRLLHADNTRTVIAIETWRSRSLPRGKKLLQMEISDQGVSIRKC